MDPYQHDAVFLSKGYRFLAGTDEAGMGAMAGPVVAATVVIDLTKPIITAPLQLKTKIKQVKLKDSKQLPPVEREALYSEIIQQCVGYRISEVTVSEINSIQNIMLSGYLARGRSVEELQADYYLVDHFNLPERPSNSLGITKGDVLSACIAAASILAKVTRDRYMKNLALQSPGYNWDKNFGYCTQDHVDAVHKLGVTSHHRLYYKPIQLYLDGQNKK